MKASLKIWCLLRFQQLSWLLCLLWFVLFSSLFGMSILTKVFIFTVLVLVNQG